MRLTLDQTNQPYFTFDPPLEHPGDPIEEAALKFHKENPHIIREIVQVCLRARKQKGWTHWGIKAAYEVVRYNGAMSTSGRTYKLNNNHTACYARWIMRDVPELANFFCTRCQGRVAQEYDE